MITERYTQQGLFSWPIQKSVHMVDTMMCIHVHATLAVYS